MHNWMSSLHYYTAILLLTMQAMKAVADSGGKFHILVIVADGQVWYENTYSLHGRIVLA